MFRLHVVSVVFISASLLLSKWLLSTYLYIPGQHRDIQKILADNNDEGFSKLPEIK